jgi:hypothetical protein
MRKAWIQNVSEGLFITELSHIYSCIICCIAEKSLSNLPSTEVNSISQSVTVEFQKKEKRRCWPAEEYGVHLLDAACSVVSRNSAATETQNHKDPHESLKIMEMMLGSSYTCNVNNPIWVALKRCGCPERLRDTGTIQECYIWEEKKIPIHKTPSEMPHYLKGKQKLNVDGKK